MADDLREFFDDLEEDSRRSKDNIIVRGRGCTSKHYDPQSEHKANNGSYNNHDFYCSC